MCPIFTGISNDVPAISQDCLSWLLACQRVFLLIDFNGFFKKNVLSNAIKRRFKSEIMPRCNSDNLHKATGNEVTRDTIESLNTLE